MVRKELVATVAVVTLRRSHDNCKHAHPGGDRAASRRGSENSPCEFESRPPTSKLGFETGCFEFDPWLPTVKRRIESETSTVCSNLRASNPN